MNEIIGKKKLTLHFSNIFFINFEYINMLSHIKKKDIFIKLSFNLFLFFFRHFFFNFN